MDYPIERSKNDKKHIFIWGVITLLQTLILNQFIGLWSTLFIPTFIIGAYITSKGYMSNEEWLNYRKTSL